MRLASLVFLLGPLLTGLPAARALQAELLNADGEQPFSAAFLRDYDTAHQEAYRTHSAGPVEKLLETYTRPEERAELEVAIAALYAYQTGIADPAKAIPHLSRVLAFHLPPRKLIWATSWRGALRERLGLLEPALKDYLRGLAICSQHLVTETWPVIEHPAVPIYMNSSDPENAERNRDYHRYHDHIRLQQDLLRERHAFIENVKRVQAGAGFDRAKILQMLAEVSPDPRTAEQVSGWLDGPNERLWP